MTPDGTDEYGRPARRRLDDEFLTRREAEALLAAGKSQMEAAKDAHDAVHVSQLTALETAMAVAERDRVAHNLAHEREHELHAEKHNSEKQAVQVALEAVSRERNIHAEAHQREHLAHAGEHALNNLAITKAEKATDDRFAAAKVYQEQNNDLARRMVTRDQFDTQTKEHDRRYEEMRARIENIEKGGAKIEGKGLGQGSVIAYIVTAVGLVGGILGIVIILANWATRPVVPV